MLLINKFFMSVLHIAQKNSIAKEVANILSNSRKRNIPTLSKYNPIFQFQLDGKMMRFTSVRGHIFDHQLPQECKNWSTFDNKKILLSEVPMVRKLGFDMDSLVKNIEDLAKDSKELVLWLDCDREGEAIAFEVMEICLKKNRFLKIARARFSAVTDVDIWNAYENLVQPNKKQADAVNYRIQIDFRLGCAFTRYQTVSISKVFRTVEKSVISYGPCQMPTLTFVVDRFLEIKNFKPEKYWFIDAICVIDENTGITFKWSKKNTRNELEIHETYVRMTENSIDGQVKGKVKEKKKIPKKKYRPYPLITVKFQKLATDKLKMSSAHAMQIAQKLYQKGFISYPRTQTNSFPKNMDLKFMLERLKGSNGTFDSYISKLLDQDKFLKPKVGTQNDQAHSPIHPVKAATQDQLAPDQWKIYDLISRHFLACCSQDAVGQEFQVKADIAGEDFKASYLTVLQKNYLQIYIFERWVQTSFPAQIPNQFPVMLNLQEGKTTPPSYLSEADLIDLMEKNQIGTDSTIHQHIQTIQKRQYAIKTSNTFKPTDLGAALVQGYRKLQIKLPQCQIRRNIEQNMSRIANGELEKDRATRDTLNQMIPIFCRLNQIKESWIRAMKQLIQEHSELKKVCIPIHEGSFPDDNTRTFNNYTNNFGSNRNINPQNSNYSGVKCFICGEAGHIAPNCPQKDRNKDDRSQSVLKCFKCGKTGHFSSSCPDNNSSKKKVTSAFKCFKCGEPGHLAPNCPKTQIKKVTNIVSKKQKKQCPECGAQGRHPKNSSCSQIKRRKNKSND